MKPPEQSDSSEKAAAEKAAAEKAAAEKAAAEKAAAVRDPLVITVSRLAEMTEAEKNDFRSRGGTVTNDPQES